MSQRIKLIVERATGDWIVSGEEGILSYMHSMGQTVPDALRNFAQVIEAYANTVDDALAGQDDTCDVEIKAQLDPLLGREIK